MSTLQEVVAYFNKWAIVLPHLNDMGYVQYQALSKLSVKNDSKAMELLMNTFLQFQYYWL